mgnify:CR=1 FL=1
MAGLSAAAGVIHLAMVPVHADGGLLEPLGFAAVGWFQLAIAAVIHFAFAPDHFAAQTSHGMFFMVVAWVQVAIALSVALGKAPSRLAPLLGALFNLGVLGAWITSRTVGIDGPAVDRTGTRTKANQTRHGCITVPARRSGYWRTGPGVGR